MKKSINKQSIFIVILSLVMLCSLVLGATTFNTGKSIVSAGTTTETIKSTVVKNASSVTSGALYDNGSGNWNAVSNTGNGRGFFVYNVTDLYEALTDSTKTVSDITLTFELYGGETAGTATIGSSSFTTNKVMDSATYAISYLDMAKYGKSGLTAFNNYGDATNGLSSSFAKVGDTAENNHVNIVDGGTGATTTTCTTRVPKNSVCTTTFNISTISATSGPSIKDYIFTDDDNVFGVGNTEKYILIRFCCQQYKKDNDCSCGKTKGIAVKSGTSTISAKVTTTTEEEETYEPQGTETYSVPTGGVVVKKDAGTAKGVTDPAGDDKYVNVGDRGTVRALFQFEVSSDIVENVNARKLSFTFYTMEDMSAYTSSTINLNRIQVTSDWDEGAVRYSDTVASGTLGARINNINKDLAVSDGKYAFTITVDANLLIVSDGNGGYDGIYTNADTSKKYITIVIATTGTPFRVLSKQSGYGAYMTAEEVEEETFEAKETYNKQGTDVVASQDAMVGGSGSAEQAIAKGEYNYVLVGNRSNTTETTSLSRAFFQFDVSSVTDVDAQKLTFTFYTMEDLSAYDMTKITLSRVLQTTENWDEKTVAWTDAKKTVDEETKEVTYLGILGDREDGIVMSLAKSTAGYAFTITVPAKLLVNDDGIYTDTNNTPDDATDDKKYITIMLTTTSTDIRVLSRESGYGAYMTVAEGCSSIITGNNMTLSDSLTYSVYANTTGYDYTSFTTVFTIGTGDTAVTYTDSTPESVDGGTKFTIELAPQLMSANIKIELKGFGITLDTKETTIKDYLTGIYNDSSSSNELKNLVASLLDYGAAAQSYYVYDKDNLVNSTITLGTNAANPAYDTTNVFDASSKDIITGATVKFAEKNSIVFKVSDTKSDIKYDYYVTGYDKVKNADASGQIFASSISPLDYDKVYTIVAYEKGADTSSATPVATVTNFSINYYCAKIYEEYSESETPYLKNMANLAKALYNYGACAEAYAG